MYIIIAGCLKVGSNLALELSQENHDVVVIDSDPSNFDALGTGFNGVTIAGMPIDEDILRSAGIEQADALAAVTSDDNMNVMVSQVAKEIFHVPVVITRVYDPRRGVIMNKMGLTTVCPTNLAVKKLKSLLHPDSRVETVNIAGTDIVFHTTKPSRKLIGKSLAETGYEKVFGIIRDGAFSMSALDTVIDADDLLVVAQQTSLGE